MVEYLLPIKEPSSCSLEGNNTKDSRRYSALFASHEIIGGGGSSCISVKANVLLNNDPGVYFQPEELQVCCITFTLKNYFFIFNLFY